MNLPVSPNMPRTTEPPQPIFPPVIAQFPGEDLVVGGGVAIFHIASGRVVICSAHDRRGVKYYFLPKGRRDAGEESRTGAEREGYEEVVSNFDCYLKSNADCCSSQVIAIACSLFLRSIASRKATLA